MLFLSCSRILLFPRLFSPNGPNKVVLSPSCIWIRCIRTSFWYSNELFNSDLVETFKTNAFKVSFNVFVLDFYNGQWTFKWVIGPFETCNGPLLMFLGWSTSRFTLVGWINPFTKSDPKPLLVSPNPNPNKP
jgi:hypothetical protein